MNTKSITTILLSGFLFQDFSEASTVIIDDFSSGQFSINSNGTTRDTSLISSSIASSRWSRGSGSDNWTASVDSDTSTLSYAVSNPIATTRFAITYSSSTGSLDLIGLSALLIEVNDLVGFGQIYAFEGSSSSLLDVIPVDLTITGSIIIPFANMNTANPTNPSELTFYIVPQSPDFAITISSIGAIPEPTSAIMITISAFTLILRRRRKQ